MRRREFVGLLGAAAMWPLAARPAVHRAHIAELTLARKLPTIFYVRDYVEAGGLASYGSDYYAVMGLTGSASRSDA